MLTAEQHALRATGVGASEVAELVGMSPYRGALDLWCAKTGRAMSRPETGETAVGDALEGALVLLLGQRIGVEFTRPRSTFRHPRHRHVLASPDAVARGRRGGEIKVVGWRMAHHWADETVPDYVRLQCLQNMAVLGAEVWYVGALVGGTDFRVHTVERDKETEDLLADSIETFWEAHVIPDAPPDPTDPFERRRWLRTRYPGSEATKTRSVADPVVADAVERMREIDIEREGLAEERRTLEEAICEIIGDDYGISGPWGKALWFPTAGAPAWKEIAEELAGGAVPAEVVERHRGDKGRTFRLYDPPKPKQLRRKTRTT